MGFWKDWYCFLKSNAKKNMKRFSITIGAFIFLVISSLALPFEVLIAIVYAGAVQTSGIIIMSLFGKNGNGSNHNALETKSIEINKQIPDTLFGGKFKVREIPTLQKDNTEAKEPMEINKQKIPI